MKACLNVYIRNSGPKGSRNVLMRYIFVYPLTLFRFILTFSAAFGFYELTLFLLNIFADGWTREYSSGKDLSNRYSFLGVQNLPCLASFQSLRNYFMSVKCRQEIF